VDRCAHKSPRFAPAAVGQTILVNLVENAAFAEVNLLRLRPTTKNVIDREKLTLAKDFSYSLAISESRGR